MAPLYIIGTGPGAVQHLTDAARQALAESTTIIGYDSYIEQLRPLLSGKTIQSTGMMREVERCREALDRANGGEAVALISGGDSGIYGMAGLVLELLEDSEDKGIKRPDIRIIPGISAIQAGASLLGAPLMHDFAVISLSDLLTPWNVITSRLEAAARADFVIVLFNPRSKTRVTHIEEARRIILASRSPQTPAGIVRNASRPEETVIVTTLQDLLHHDIDMSSVVFIGNSSSFTDGQGRIVTPRGYAGKYGGSKPSSRSDVETSKPDAVMFCGTASDVGKSIITAGFCRCLSRRGVSVAPFKSQNMSLNSSVTPEGGEIGRAQAVQAQACGIEPHVDMNPILLKPNSDTGSQVIVQGSAVNNMNVKEYDAYKPTAFEKVAESYSRLKDSHEFIVIEGAGSISEINLKDNDIANLKIAMMANCPVILVADIDRGGVFAQIAGTIDLLEPQEKSLIHGIIINKFRGDPTILESGLDFIRKRFGIPVIGVLPWLSDLGLPAEDSVSLSHRPEPGAPIPAENSIRIGVMRLPRISNFTDFDIFRYEKDCILTYIERAEQVNGLDILILPGSKSTIPDLCHLKERGVFDAIRGFRGRIIGICGGYQMLGKRVLDPHGIESECREAVGFGLLPVETELRPVKETHQVQACLDDAGLALAPGCTDVMAGYEIHMGVTTPLGKSRPFSRVIKRGAVPVMVDDGSVSWEGRVFGTYIHGIFDNICFRNAYLNLIRKEKGLPLHNTTQQQDCLDPFNRLADHLEQHLDMARLAEICGFDW